MCEHKISVDTRRAQTALQILEAARQAVQSGRSADHFLAQCYRENRKYGSKDRRFYSSVVFAWFRWGGLLDALKDTPPLAAAIASFLDSGVNTPPLQALGLPDQLTSSALPATVHDKIDTLRKLIPELAHISPMQLIPPWIPAACTPREMDQDSFVRPFLAAIQKRPPAWFRLKKKDAEQTYLRLQQELPDLTLLPGSRVTCHTFRRFNMAQLQKKTAPGIEIQDLASQCVGHICAPQKGDEWWDVCAGSGGKTLHLADLMQNSGKIVATDVRAHILKNLNQRAARSKITCIQTTRVEQITACARTFDGILVDAPCSSIGTWARNPDARWRIDKNYLADRASIQKQLLNTAATHLKPDGRLIYSVCTLSHAETTDIVDAFLQEHPHFSPLPFQHPIHNTPTSGQCQIFPWDGPCNGMFIAALTRD